MLDLHNSLRALAGFIWSPTWGVGEDGPPDEYGVLGLEALVSTDSGLRGRARAGAPRPNEPVMHHRPVSQALRVPGKEGHELRARIPGPPAAAPGSSWAGGQTRGQSACMPVGDSPARRNLIPAFNHTFAFSSSAANGKALRPEPGPDGG